MKRSLSAALVTGLLFAGASVFGASTSANRPTANNAVGRTASPQKADPVLVRLYRSQTGSPARVAPSTVHTQIMPSVHNGVLMVNAIADSSAQKLASDLAALGMSRPVVAGRMVSGPLPVAAIPKLQNLKSLRFARPCWTATRTGLITSGGDLAMQSATARVEFAVDGTGVNVGVLSDSFDSLGGAGLGELYNDLPLSVNVLEDIAAENGPGTDEGRAMAEIIHDVAPGAGIAFNTAFNGEADFALGILNLADPLRGNCKVIVDDVIYFDEPMFADGILAQAVNAVAASGAVYFSSAGNDARQGWEEPGGYRASGVLDTDVNYGGQMHEFVAGGNHTTLLPVTFDQGQTIIVFQWAQPYASTGASSPGASGDLDVYLCDRDGNYLVDGKGFRIGSYSNNLGGDPTEIFAYQASANNTQLALRIQWFSGTAPAAMMKIVWSGAMRVDAPFNTDSGSLFGHANATGASAVGAARYYRTTVYGIAPPLLESFSSAGPMGIFFNPDGTPVNADGTPEIRLKPEFIAPDGGNTTFFAAGLDPEGDGWPNFFGTSAAAPHAAAVAALMLQQAALTPTTVKTALEASAIDMASAGFDYDTGYGLIQADRVLAAVLPPPIQSAFDLNVDGCVDASDLAELLAAIRAGSSLSKYDVNNDGFVTMADARILTRHFTNPGGAPCH